MENGQTFYNDIDEFLGAKDGRFFGNGFSKVGNQITDIYINISPEKKSTHSNAKLLQTKGISLGYVQAKGSLSYPDDWSKKSEDTELKPHLSTIDALNLSMQLNEMFLIHKYNLDNVDREHMWLKKYSISAGNTPYENLDAFEIYTICKETVSQVSINSSVSVFESKIGALKVYCEIEHKIKQAAKTDYEFFYVDGEDILGKSESRYYGMGYKYSDYDVFNLKIDYKNEKIENGVRINRVKETPIGIEGFYRPSISMIDSIILGGQLSQALLYNIDQVEREDTGTLWMRKVTMENENPSKQNKEFVAETHITNAKIINMRGSLWRKADIYSNFNGIICNYSLAYELPKEKVQGGKI